MKLGGLTWWRNNYGSALQAFALQQQLNSFDHVDYEIICQYGKKIVSADNLKQKLRKQGVFGTANRVIRKFGLKKLRSRSAKLQRFIDDRLKVSERSYVDDIAAANEVYDGFVCGSDQVWNPMLGDVDSIYWLGFADRNKKKIAYAPSVGVDSFPEETRQTVKENLSSFDAVSTREESGTRAVREVMGDDRCVTVLDPTLLVERTLWDEVCPPRAVEESYIFVYMLRGSAVQRRAIERFAREKQLKIVTMPFLDPEKLVLYDFRFGDIRLWDADPLEFISAIRYADYVFTDSFHCSVFSCLYHRPFFVFPKIGKAQVNRLTGLQQLLRIPSRMIDENTTVEMLMMTPDPDWDAVDAVLREKRAFSLAYLKNAVSE